MSKVMILDLQGRQQKKASKPKGYRKKPINFKGRVFYVSGIYGRYIFHDRGMRSLLDLSEDIMMGTDLFKYGMAKNFFGWHLTNWVERINQSPPHNPKALRLEEFLSLEQRRIKLVWVKDQKSCVVEFLEHASRSFFVIREDGNIIEIQYAEVGMQAYSKLGGHWEQNDFIKLFVPKNRNLDFHKLINDKDLP